MALRPGEPFGRYRVEALLGEGGMGQVYRATDERLRRQVALKVISGLGAGAAERLLREARAAAAIDHPNAVAIFDVGEVDGIPFLAMELVEGSTLRPYVGATAPLAQRRRRRLGRIVAASGLPRPRRRRRAGMLPQG